MIRSRFLNRVLCAALLGLVAASGAHAVPVLQLYIEGSTYDTDHESWVFDATLGDAFTLWVIGNTTASRDDMIRDLQLVAVYPDPVANDGGSLNISLTPTTTGGFGGFIDPSSPGVPSGPDILSEAGDAPTMSDGRALASHGVFRDGNEWQQFGLGDMTLTDSPIADFIGSLPTPSGLTGQINAYEVVVTANDPAAVGPLDIHFDVFGTIEVGNHDQARFAPYSHDAGTGINSPVPAPASFALALVAFALLLFARCGAAGVPRLRGR